MPSAWGFIVIRPPTVYEQHVQLHDAMKIFKIFTVVNIATQSQDGNYWANILWTLGYSLSL